jgi:RNA polymerase sigma-70 factor (ECF subfamily)
MPDWQVILSRDGPAAWRTAYRLLGNRDDADECFQEACLAALDISRRQPVHNWQGLLVRLAALRSVDRLRVNRRARLEKSSGSLEQFHDTALPPNRLAEDAELADELREALGLIPARQAEVFCLHCLEDWTYQEVAGHLAISIDSVGVLLFRARSHLRKLLARFEEPTTASRSIGVLKVKATPPPSSGKEPS